MPIYEYQCSECGHTLEKLQNRTDPAPETCPSCQAKSTLSRIISQTSFHLKGGGWYVTDYKGKNTSTSSPETTSSSPTTSTESTSAAPSTESTSTPSGGADSGSTSAKSASG